MCYLSVYLKLTIIGTEDDNMKIEFEKEDDSEMSVSSNEDFEVCQQ